MVVAESLLDLDGEVSYSHTYVVWKVTILSAWRCISRSHRHVRVLITMEGACA